MLLNSLRKQDDRKIHSCFKSIASWLGQVEHPRYTNNRLTLLQVFACLYIAVSDPLPVKSTIRTKVKRVSISGFSRKGNFPGRGKC